jgi:hypothetical protein
MDKEKLLQEGFIEVTDISLSDIIKVLPGQFKIEETYLKPNKEPRTNVRTLSTEFGMNPLPFHTDGAHRLIPPRWTILQYGSKTESKSGTLLFDSKPASADPHYEDLFFNEIYIVTGGVKPFLTSIINKQLSSLPIFRWNKLLMRKLLDKTKVTIDYLAIKPHHKVTWSPRKTLILDNWRILHSREEVPKEEENTRIMTRYNLS